MDERISIGHGIEEEPDPGARARSDASEASADETLERERAAGGAAREEALASVFEEEHDVRVAPGERILGARARCAACGAPLGGRSYGEPCPRCAHVPAQDWAEWYLRRRARTSLRWSAFVSAVVALVGGPLALLGAFLVDKGPLMLLVFGPTAEEVLKIVAVTFVVETRPYLLRSAFQIRVAAFASALLFAAVENVLYLEVYIPDPTAGLALWRWTACTALHLAATSLAAQGLVVAWRKADGQLAKPDLAPVFPWLLAAIVLHGLYNGTVGFLSIAMRDF